MTTEDTARVGIYGDVDLNVIDGSAVWLASLAEVLATQPGMDVHVALKTRIERDLLTAGLTRHANITLWPPDRLRVTPTDAPEQLAKIDAVADLDVLIVRGRSAAREVARSGRFLGRLWVYLTDIPQQFDEMTVDDLADLDEMFSAATRVMCQTENLRAFLVRCLPTHDSKYLLLPPMVPDLAFREPMGRPAGRPFRMFYAGKFAPGWGVEHMAQAFGVLRESYPDIEFHVAGDKIHDPPDQPAFKPAIMRALGGDGVVWHGALSRHEVFDLLAQVDVALAMRDDFMDSSRELSTKLLEFCAAGVPVLCNRNLLHEELFGAESPLLLGGYHELVPALSALISDPERLRRLGENVRSIADSHAFAAVGKHLRPAIRQAQATRADGMLEGRTIVVSGHDLKFARPLINAMRTAGASVLEDVWGGHGRHDAAATGRALDAADTAIAEWCLGNAVHYSNAVSDNQRFIVRFHRTELNSPWPPQLAKGRSSAIVFVGEHVRQEAIGRFDWGNEPTTVIPNFLDEVSLDRPKLEGASHTLGLLGWLPALKRVDRALDLLELLRREDPRFRLVVKGSYPWDLDWVWKDQTEKAYFEDQLRRVRTSPLLTEAVTFESPGADVPSWLRSIGIILSPSDIESFHLALVEGMMSRSVPIVWDRPGAANIVADRWVAEDTRAAAETVLSWDHPTWSGLGVAARAEAVEGYRFARTWKSWLGVLGATTPTSTLEATAIPPRQSLAAIEPPLNEHPVSDAQFVTLLAQPPLAPLRRHTQHPGGQPVEGVEALLSAAESGDSSATELAAETIAGWIEDGSANQEDPATTWGFEETAERAVTLGRAWEVLRHSLPPDRTRPLVEYMVLHGLVLAVEPPDLDDTTAVEAAAALLALTCTLTGLPQVEGWSRLANERLADRVVNSFTAVGFHRSGSPAAHGRVLGVIDDLVRYANANGVDLPDGIGETRARAAAVGPYLVRANGNPAGIGDHPPHGVPTDLEGVAPAPSSRPNPRDDGAKMLVDPDAGVAVFTGGPPALPGPSEFHLIMRLNGSANSREALSVVLFAGGRDWIVDSGAPRESVPSVVALQDESGGADAEAVAEVELVEWFRTHRDDGLIARNSSPALRATRSIRVDAASGVIHLVDTAWTKAQAEQRLQLAADLTVTWNSTAEVVVTAPDGRTMRIVQHLPVRVAVEHAEPGRPLTLVYSAPGPGSYRWETEIRV